MSSQLAGFRGPDASRSTASAVTSPLSGPPARCPASHTGPSRPLFTPDVRPNPHKPPTSPHVSREESAPNHDRCDHGADGAHQPPGGAGWVGRKGRLRRTVCGRRGMRHRDGSQRRRGRQGRRPRTGGRLRAGPTERRARKAHGTGGTRHGKRECGGRTARRAQAAELQAREAQAAELQAGRRRAGAGGGRRGAGGAGRVGCRRQGQQGVTRLRDRSSGRGVWWAATRGLLPEPPGGNRVTRGSPGTAPRATSGNRATRGRPEDCSQSHQPERVPVPGPGQCPSREDPLSPGSRPRRPQARTAPGRPALHPARPA